MATKKPKTPLSVEAIEHDKATRKNIPTAEYQAMLARAEQAPMRVAGPFTVESLSPHRVLGVDENDEFIDHVSEAQAEQGRDFNAIILKNPRTAGVQQAHNHASDLGKLGRIRVLQARMNADLHMAEDLKNTGKGNLFVIFGEPDIEILDAGKDGSPGQIRVKVNNHLEDEVMKVFRV